MNTLALPLSRIQFRGKNISVILCIYIALAGNIKYHQDRELILSPNLKCDIWTPYKCRITPVASISKYEMQNEKWKPRNTKCKMKNESYEIRNAHKKMSIPPLQLRASHYLTSKVNFCFCDQAPKGFICLVMRFWFKKERKNCSWPSMAPLF